MTLAQRHFFVTHDVRITGRLLLGVRDTALADSRNMPRACAPHEGPASPRLEPGDGAGEQEAEIGRQNMRNFLITLWKDESGAAAAEYALILAVIAAGIALTAGNLGDVIAEAVKDACTEITTGGTFTATC
ncbi:MAG: Flp family type IVb pilin [Kiloniellales bacterium]